MRSVRACALVLSLVPAALSAQGGVTLQNRAPQPGDAYKVVTGALIDFDISAALGERALGSRAMSMRMAESYQVEVLEAEGMVPTRVRIRYFQSEGEVSANREPATKKVEPVAGKTYYVIAAEGGARIVDDQERPVDAKMAADIAGDASVGKADPFCSFMAGRSLSAGETLEISPEVAGPFLGSTGDDQEVQHLSLTLREVTNLRGAPAAVFEMQVKMSSRMEDGTAMSFQAAGLAAVSVADCRPLSLEMSGPMTISGTSQQDGQTLSLRGAGRVKAVMRREYGL